MGSIPGSNLFSSFVSSCFSSLSFHGSLQLFLLLVSDVSLNCSLHLSLLLSLHLSLDFSFDFSIDLSPHVSLN